MSSFGLNRWMTKNRVPLLLAAFYLVALFLVGGLTSAKTILTLCLLGLYTQGGTCKKGAVFLLPVFLTGVAYDGQRYIVEALRGHIWVAEPYHLERGWFGIDTGAERLTPNEFLQLYLNPIADLYFGLTYIAYIPIFVAIAAYFRFFLNETRGGHVFSESEKMRMMWGFFWVNFCGYALYFVYPAAPPWYVAAHGFGPAIADIAPSPAGGARFDALVGLGLHAMFYANSSNVHSAIPSVHIAYPALAVYHSFRKGALRGVSLWYYLTIFFGALYLNHHYVIDLLAGTALALAVGVGMDLLATRRSTRAGLR